LETSRRALVNALLQYPLVTVFPVNLNAIANYRKAICGQLQSINRSIKAYDHEIESLVKTHADYQIVASLPAGSSNTRARLIVALGDNRGRYGDAAGLQSASGIATLKT